MFKKIRIPKLSPVITAGLIMFALSWNVFAVYKWVGDVVVVGFAGAWHMAFFVALIASVRTLQTGDQMIGIAHMLAVAVIAYFAKLLTETMTGPAWQAVLYNTNLVVCILLSASFIATLTASNSSKVHDGMFDEDYTKNKKNFFNKKSNRSQSRRQEPEDIPFEEFKNDYGRPGGR